MATKYFTVSYDEKSCAELERTAQRLGGKTIERAIVHSGKVGISLIQAEKELGMSIILRDSAGNEWCFSVDTPGKATPVHPPEPPRGRKKSRVEGNVLHLDFGKR